MLARNLLKGLLHFKAFRQRLIHQSVKEKLNEEMSEVHLVSELEKGAEVEEELAWKHQAVHRKTQSFRLCLAVEFRT